MLKQECAAKLAKAAQGKNYTNLLKQLIIQGLIKIEEDTVEIQCRQEDTSKVQQVVCFDLHLILRSHSDFVAARSCLRPSPSSSAR